MNTMRPVSIVLGAQFGDEGKGKLVDILAEQFPIIGRATGGANAGHTVIVGDKKFVFHLLPSGMLHLNAKCVIGNGVVLHLPTMFSELDTLNDAGVSTKDRLFISDRATLLFEYHKILDALQEERKGESKVGTTKRGIGPCYAEKISRHALRISDLLREDTFEAKYRACVSSVVELYGIKDYDLDCELSFLEQARARIAPMVLSSAYYLFDAISNGTPVLVEGANGAMLDIDHGTYPYVTSSNATIGGVLTGLGLPPHSIGEVVGIVKAYLTRVGSGPFPTELLDETGDKIRNAGGEFGSTTGRPRRCGWLDLFQLKYSKILNGFTSFNLTKLDVLRGIPEIKVCVGYCVDGKELLHFPASLDDLAAVEPIYKTFKGFEEDLSAFKKYEELPTNVREYIEFIEQELKTPILYIGTGPKRDQMIMRS